MQTPAVTQDAAGLEALVGLIGAPADSAAPEAAMPFADILNQDQINALIADALGVSCAQDSLSAEDGTATQDSEEAGGEADADSTAELASLWLSTDWAAAVSAPAGNGDAGDKKTPWTGMPASVENGGEAKEAAGAKRDFNVGRFLRSFPDGWEALLADETGAAVAARTADGEMLKAAAEDEALMRTVAAELLPAGDGGQKPAVGESGIRTEQGTPVRAEVPTAQTPEPGKISLAAATASSLNDPQTNAASSKQPTAEGKAESAPDAAGGEDPRISADYRTEIPRDSAAAGTSSRAAAAGSAPAQVLARLTEMQRALVVDRLAQSSLSAFAGNEDSVTVELHPPELGRVRVTVENQGQQVNTVLTVQDSALSGFFQEHSDSLRRSLEQAGIKLGTLSVEVRQDFGREMQEQEAPGWERHAASSAWAVSRTASAGDRMKSSAWRPAGTSQVDLMI